ncbi:MAG: DUF982 domain-containing protein [Mesorhizobium sp.]
MDEGVVRWRDIPHAIIDKFGEAMKKFSASLWVKDGDFNVRSVASVEEAIAFLADWPITERTALFYAAANSVESAKAGSIPPDVAKTALVVFLEEADALAEGQIGP